ncbi:MAG: DEAD/DEAH box helicase, partial [Waterburya sp.]
MNIAWQEVKEKFQQIWGYENFRYPQGEIIRSLLTGKDALIILPTGGGKSICFQLPA